MIYVIFFLEPASRKIPILSGRSVLQSQLQDWSICKHNFSTLSISWIKEVEIAQSINDLMTLQTIELQFLSGFEILDTKIASVLEKLLLHFRKRVDVEEQRTQKDDRFSRGRQIAHMIYRVNIRCKFINMINGWDTLTTKSWSWNIIWSYRFWQKNLILSTRKIDLSDYVLTEQYSVENVILFWLVDFFEWL